MTISYNETTVYTVKVHAIVSDPETGLVTSKVRNSYSFENKARAANDAYVKFTGLVNEWQTELVKLIQTKTANLVVSVEMLVADVCDGTKISLVYWSDEVIR